MNKADLNLLSDVVENELPFNMKNKMEFLYGTAVIIPVLNEEDSILAVLQELITKGINSRHIYVVDNGSTDRTVELARSYDINLLVCPEKGKGNALKFGFKQILNNPEIVRIVTIDGDYTYPADAVVMSSILSEWFHNDVIIMKRVPLKEAMPFLNSLANLIINLWARIVNPPYFPSVSDICSGLWCFPVGIMGKVYPLLKSNGFTIESEYYCILNSIGRPMYEFKWEYRPRVGGEKKTRPIDALRIMKFIWDNR